MKASRDSIDIYLLNRHNFYTINKCDNQSVIKIMKKQRTVILTDEIFFY